MFFNANLPLIIFRCASLILQAIMITLYTFRILHLKREHMQRLEENYSSMEEAVEEIIRLDKDDAAYLEKMMTPFWLYGANFQEFRDSEIKK